MIIMTEILKVVAIMSAFLLIDYMATKLKRKVMKIIV